jgi:hypoxanthine phosphoribosyltransferase
MPDTPIEVLIPAEKVRARLPTLAAEIHHALPPGAHEDGLVLVGLLKGAFVFMADLARELSALGTRLEIDFMTLSSYGDATITSGTVRLVTDLSLDLAGRHVLLVDDIVDSGRTIAFARDHLLARGPASLTTALFMDKPARREVDVTFDHVGFKVPDVFVIGYGGDYAQRYRELPFIGILGER